MTAFSLSSASFFACLTLFSFLDTPCQFDSASPVIRCPQSSVFRIEKALYGADLPCLFRFSLSGGEYRQFMRFLGVLIDEPWSIPLSTTSKRGKKSGVFVILTLSTNHDSQNAVRPRYGLGEGERPSGTSLLGVTNDLCAETGPSPP